MRWPRLRLTSKILVAFLSLSVVALSVVGILALGSLRGLGNYALESNSDLGQSATEDSTKTLEELGAQIIEQKARDVASQVNIYLASHSGMDLAGLQKDTVFRQIAVQDVGETGYTALLDAYTLVTRFHPTVEGVDLHTLSESLPALWTIIQQSQGEKPSAGYYDWKEPDGSIRAKYMYITPVSVRTSEGVSFNLAATTYIDEFTRPINQTRDRITAAAAQATEHINDEIRRNQYLFIGIFTGLLLVVAAVGFWLARTISRPVMALSAGAKIIGAGQLDHRVQVRTGDEIQDLAESFNKMASDLKTYVQDLKETTVAKERIESDLRIATEIQTSMLPRIFPPFPHRKEFDIYATMYPAKEVGGDFFDFFLVAENKFCFIIGDVCGKGVPAALFMAISKTLLKMEALAGYDPAEVLTRVNNTLYPDNDSSMFFTGLCAIMDTDTGELHVANGGHNPPLLSSGGREFEFMNLARGIPVGPMPDSKYQCTRLTLPPRSVIFLYTDGVTEATNLDDQLFSETRLRQSLVRLTGADPASLIDGARADVEAFVHGAPQSDDITMLALRFNGKEPPR